MLFQKSPCKLISVCTVSCIQCLHTLEKSMKSKAKDGNIFKIKLSSPFGLHSLVPLSFFFFFLVMAIRSQTWWDFQSLAVGRDLLAWR